MTLKDTEEALAKEEKLRKQLEETNAKLLAEKNDLFNQLQQQKEGLSDVELRTEKLMAQKNDLEKQISVITASIHPSGVCEKR